MICDVVRCPSSKNPAYDRQRFALVLRYTHLSVSQQCKQVTAATKPSDDLVGELGPDEDVCFCLEVVVDDKVDLMVPKHRQYMSGPPPCKSSLQVKEVRIPDARNNPGQRALSALEQASLERRVTRRCSLR